MEIFLANNGFCASIAYIDGEIHWWWLWEVNGLLELEGKNNVKWISHLKLYPLTTLFYCIIRPVIFLLFGNRSHFKEFLVGFGLDWLLKVIERSVLCRFTFRNLWSCNNPWVSFCPWRILKRMRMNTRWLLSLLCTCPKLFQILIPMLESFDSWNLVHIKLHSSYIKWRLFCFKSAL